VDSGGRFYISDYYHDNIDAWEHEGARLPPPNGPYVEYYYEPEKRPPYGGQGYLTQITNVDPIDGPCALALDSEDNVYVNDYHRSVIKYSHFVPDYSNFSPPFGSFGSTGTLIAGQGVDTTHPTGVAVDPATDYVYVDDRTYVSVYQADGTPVMDGLNPLRIGVGSLEDGYAVAVSTYPGTEGDIYVPDAATNTVKIYDTAVSKVNPVDEIDASDTPRGHFVSLRDASIAIDRVSGEVYVVDNLQPAHTETPEAIVDVFDAAGNYEGHLLNKVVDALPVGLAVDNSTSPRFTGYVEIPPEFFEESAKRVPNGTQGLVYVTSGNTDAALLYNYSPDAATMAEPDPAAFALSMSVAGPGSGSVSSSMNPRDCASSCEETLPAGSEVVLTARAQPGSAFSGWSGSCAGSDPSCAIKLDGGASAQAHFDLAGSSAAEGQGDGSTATGSVAPEESPPVAAAPPHRRHRNHHHRHRRHRRARHHRAAKR
jgi:hypothetical protein